MSSTSASAATEMSRGLPSRAADSFAQRDQATSCYLYLQNSTQLRICQSSYESLSSESLQNYSTSLVSLCSSLESTRLISQLLPFMAQSHFASSYNDGLTMQCWPALWLWLNRSAKGTRQIEGVQYPKHLVITTEKAHLIVPSRSGPLKHLNKGQSRKALSIFLQTLSRSSLKNKDSSTSLRLSAETTQIPQSSIFQVEPMEQKYQQQKLAFPFSLQSTRKQAIVLYQLSSVLSLKNSYSCLLQNRLSSDFLHLYAVITSFHGTATITVFGGMSREAFTQELPG